MADSAVLQGPYQLHVRREPERWRIVELKITVTFWARLQILEVGGRATPGVLGHHSLTPAGADTTLA